jgi:hypothetical protein
MVAILEFRNLHLNRSTGSHPPLDAEYSYAEYSCC